MYECLSPIGFENEGLVGPKRAIDGVPAAPAIWSPTESLPKNKSDLLIISAWMFKGKAKKIFLTPNQLNQLFCNYILYHFPNQLMQCNDR